MPGEVNDYPKLVLDYDNEDAYGHQEIYTFVSQKGSTNGVEIVILDMSRKKKKGGNQKTKTTCLVMHKEEAKILIRKLQAAIDEDLAGLEAIDRNQLELLPN